MKTAINISVAQGTFTVWELNGRLYTPKGYKVSLSDMQLRDIKQAIAKADSNQSVSIVSN